MKKQLIKVAFVAAIAVACGLNVFNSQKSETLSEVALANVEALADVDPNINPECPNGCLDDGEGCYCYHQYADYKEAKWPWLFSWVQ